jgi:hypothetical protein
LYTLIEDARFIVIDGQPLALIWTHAEVVTEALRRFLDRQHTVGAKHSQAAATPGADERRDMCYMYISAHR